MLTPEAAYASSLKRARIPLLVDPGYTAEGWLALMTAGDYHYDFVRKPFETKIVELINELERRCLKGQGEMSDGVVKQEVVSQQSSQVVVSSQGYPSAPCAHGEYSTSRPTNAAHSSKRAEMIKVAKNVLSQQQSYDKMSQFSLTRFLCLLFRNF